MIEIDFTKKDDQLLIGRDYRYVLNASGSKFLRDEKGNLHSYDDLPASISDNEKMKQWFKHGVRHRDNDLPAYIHEGTLKVWFVDGIETKREYL